MLQALTPLTIGRTRVAASALGALWGFGHSTGQLILGLVMILLKDRFHDFLPALERWSGLVVALTLIAIGALGIYESHFAKEEEGHAEEEQAAMQLALAGGPSAAAAGVRAKSLKASLATYATGIVYGLQPDALFVVIPALALPTKLAAVAYCTTFVVGTVMAMGGYTLLIGTTSAALTKERPWLQAHLSTVASAVAILVGVLIGLAGLGVQVPFFS
ncbi:nickel transporter [Haematococcus lacustris]